ncbi:MAG: NAD(P)-binding protein, partial [Fibrobacter sp.]|nr:NAD(P)-binding protein [Fibrobacter sp.]
MSNVQESINYDLVIVGAGAAGLYAAAHLALSLSGLESKKRVLLVEQKKETGKKLLLTGSGQCNLTNSKNIRDFVPCYGENGSKIRSVLYAHNNIDTMSFFKSQGLPLWVREDAKVFPETLNAKDVRGLLL